MLHILGSTSAFLENATVFLSWRRVTKSMGFTWPRSFEMPWQNSVIVTRPSPSSKMSKRIPQRPCHQQSLAKWCCIKHFLHETVMIIYNIYIYIIHCIHHIALCAYGLHVSWHSHCIHTLPIPALHYCWIGQSTLPHCFIFKLQCVTMDYLQHINQYAPN